MIPYLGGLLLSVASNELSYWILLFIMQYICSAHINLSRKNICICSMVSAICFALCFISGITDLGFYCMFLLLILSVMVFSTRRFKDLFLLPLALVFYIVLTIMPQSLLEELHPAFAKQIHFSEYSFTYLSRVIDILLLAALIYLRKLLAKYETLLPLSWKEIAGCFGVLFFCFVDIGLLMGLKERNSSPIYHYIWLTILVGFFLMGVGYYFYNLIDKRVSFYRQTLTKNDTEYLKLQLESLQNSKENEEHVKRMRHDLKNHLTIINTLCEEERYEELREYTASLNQEAASMGNFIFTGNDIADMVLRSKMQLATQMNILFEFDGTLEALRNLEAPDICGLLSNAYDNALEACADIPNAYIRTKVSTTPNYTVIQITNPVHRQVPIHNNSITTTKVEKHAHGYGMDIMKRIACKYKGSCIFECSDEEFTVKIRLLT